MSRPTLPVRASRLAPCLLLLLAAPAAAETLSAPQAIASEGENVAITFAPAGFDNATVFAGPLSTSLDGGPAFDAYCVDLFDVVAGSFRVDVLPVAKLSGTSVVPGSGAAVGWLYDTYAPAVTTTAEGAGLQLAIWETEYDGTGGLDGGAFRATARPEVLDEASGYLKALAARSTLPTTALWFRATDHPNRTNQNFVGPAAVPEPAGLALLGLGLAGVAGLARRSRRRAAR